MDEFFSEAQHQPPEPDIELALDEFCTRLSRTDRRVEMIGGFHADEKRAGRVKDTEPQFQARFKAFCNKPV